MTPEQELLTILNQLPAAIEKAFTDALVLRHPGHANQKTHGNRFGAGQAKESLRRLKDDKGAREKYKAAARGRGQGSGASKFSDEEQGYIKSKLSQIQSLRSDKQNTYKQQQAATIEQRLKNLMSGKEKFPSDIYGPAPKVKARKPKAPPKPKGNPDKIDPSTANEALKMAKGDKTVAWSYYVKLKDLRPGADAKDLFAFLGR